MSNCGWPLAVGFLFGIGAAFTILVIAFAANEQDVGKKYRECIALGAPADNCLKKYVLPDNQKGE